MSTTITLEQTNTLETTEAGTPLYRSHNEVTASEGITQALFVYSVDTEAYTHMASVYDIETYPESKAAAEIAGLLKYRQVSADRAYTTLTEALAFAAHVRSRLNFLTQDYPATQNTFVGSATYTFPLGS